MSDFATSRLLDAAATLDPADRALLNIWMNRGLDDAAVARMTGVGVKTIADRRARIVEHLSAVLRLPPEDVHSALTQIAPSPKAARPAAADAPPANGTAPSELGSVRAGPNGGAPRELVTPAGNAPDTDATAPAPLEPEAGSPSRRRRWPWIACGLVAIVLAVVLLVSLTSSGSGHHRAPAPASKHSPPPTSSTIPSPSPPAARQQGEPLLALPGGVVQTTGTLFVSRKGSRRTLNLSVRGLPALSHGHYEVWLYNSLVNSKPLGRLRTGERHLSLRLRDSARRYRWIDISIQPAGVVFHSGESVLRAANPLFAQAGARHP